MFKKSQDEAHRGEIDVKKKSVAFKAQDSKNEEESRCQEEESNEEMPLFVKRFNRMMSKKGESASRPLVCFGGLIDTTIKGLTILLSI